MSFWVPTLTRGKRRGASKNHGRRFEERQSSGVAWANYVMQQSKIIPHMGCFLKPFVHTYRNLTCTVPWKPHQGAPIVIKWQKTSKGVDGKLFLMKTDVCTITTQLLPSCHVRIYDDAISCLPRWLAQTIASPAYRSSVICPYNTYTHSHTRTHTRNSSASAPLSSEKKAAFYAQMSAFTLWCTFF